MPKGTHKQNVSFKMLSNLIVIPIQVNGRELNFILDSGVGSTILFNLNPTDSLNLRNIEKLKLQGLGQDGAVEAILSRGNELKFGAIKSNKQKLYVVFNDSFDLSSKLGITIHGIIGYELLKDFIVRINYSSKRLTFFTSEGYKDKLCRKCEVIPIEFNMMKPYINVGVVLKEAPTKKVNVKLLIDSGGSDAMWLFENTHPDIVAPTKYFNDFLGEGLSGAIYGKRTMIESLHIGDFTLKNPTVSYPDSLSVAHALKFKGRNGSLGGTILNRFVVTFDYRNNRLLLKKGGKFKDPFRYNMSGIELVHNGKRLVKEKAKPNTLNTYSNNPNASNVTVTLDTSFKYTFKPTYKIQKLRPNSPAALAGIRVGDVLIKINGKYTFDLKLEEIVQYFYEKENTKVTVVVERFGKDYEYSFRLKDMLK
ncbi:PDZ domain-containing protein [Lutibacter holmesii]|uniref:PDZ domain-containing protein n=1 Tax=Lutibacter holmesii TaxID=1137985 RepID=A0ABW3WRK3_9FLAO